MVVRSHTFDKILLLLAKMRKLEPDVHAYLKNQKQIQSREKKETIVVFRTLDIKKQRLMSEIPGTWEADTVNSAATQLTALLGLQATAGGGEGQVEPGRLPELWS